MSNIEWTDTTWNPVVGCTPVSPGCLNCYAATMARRLEAMGRPEYVKLTIGKMVAFSGEPGDHPGNPRTRRVFNGTVRTLEDRLTDPLHWRKPRRVFVNSMSDLFHEDVPFAFIDRVFAVMALCPKHQFQVLTKRPERMAEYLESRRIGDEWSGYIALEAERFGPVNRRVFDAAMDLEGHGPLPNVWLGTSVEDQARADERIPHLLRCPAAVRFLSCEPLLGAVDLTRIPAFPSPPWPASLPGEPATYLNVLSGEGLRPSQFGVSIETYVKARIGWVVLGGESGPNARPCDVAWIRSPVKQCAALGVPCFVKQLGARPCAIGASWFKWADERGWRLTGDDRMAADAGMSIRPRLKDRKGADPSEWPEDLRVRQFPEVRQ